MRNYTTIEQSKQLAKILPVECADMHYVLTDTDENRYGAGLGKYIGVLPHYPCWSEGALLEFTKDKYDVEINHYADDNVWVVCVYFKSTTTTCSYTGELHSIEVESENLIDACVELIAALKEKGKL